MKSHDIIASTFAEWHVVDAAALAEQTFARLDADEVIRLARRAYTEEWRSELRAKDGNGIPRYASLKVRDGDSGDEVRVYKQTALFTVGDYDAVISAHMRDARSHISAAQALTRQCNAVHGTDIPIPGLELPASQVTERAS